jgi:hypothetical protein
MTSIQIKGVPERTDAVLRRRAAAGRLKCRHEPTKSVMSYGRLDIMPSSAMLELWPRELCSRCAGVTKDFAL